MDKVKDYYQVVENSIKSKLKEIAISTGQVKRGFN